MFRRKTNEAIPVGMTSFGASDCPTTPRQVFTVATRKLPALPALNGVLT